MKIAFQTLACPDWSWERIIDEAERLGYDGIEIRGIEGEMYLPKARPFLPEHLERSNAQLREKGLEICCLDTSCFFHDEGRYEIAIKEGKETIDLANKLNVPFIRVFGDAIPDDNLREEIVNRVAKGIEELGRYAEDKGVTVLLETHGDFHSYPILSSIFDRTNSPAVGMLWDFEHPFMHGESPVDTYTRLAPYIKHTHVKDARKFEEEKTLCLIGDGDVPVAEIIKLLKGGAFSGWLSLEYEKKWQPALEEPEVSLPAYIRYIRKLLEE